MFRGLVMSEQQAIPPGYRLAMWCDPDLAIAIAIANQDHGLDGYLGEALILILILAIASSHDHMPHGESWASHGPGP